MRIVCLSDTHGDHDSIAVPDGDLLIHAGDLSMNGSAHEIEKAGRWLNSLPHRHKVVIAGNHDFLFLVNPEEARRLLGQIHYLQDSEVVIETLRVWGSPWQPRFCNWAFNLDRGEPIARQWALIPKGTDILVTHGPPAGHGDMVEGGLHVGCHDLLAALQRVRPRLHVFGHVHCGYGQSRFGETLCVNASVCDQSYKPVQRPIVLDWNKIPGD